VDLHASIMNIPADRNRSDRAYKEGHRDARHAAAEMALAAEEEIERLKAENAALVEALQDVRIHLHAQGRRPEECYLMSVCDNALTFSRTESAEGE
jgi:hypothetical protein